MSQDSTKLKDKVVLITDINTDIAKQTALFCAAQGASLVINGPGGEPACFQKKILSITGQVLFTNQDVSIFENGKYLIETAIDKYQKLDALINTSYFRVVKSLKNIYPMEFYASVRYGLKSIFVTTKFACKFFRKQGFGSIVNMTSNAGLGIEDSIAYSATSEGIIGMTRTVERDMAKYGVTCNAICPGNIESASILAASLCLESMQFISGRTFGTENESIFIYQEPRPISTISKWGGFELEELQTIVPKTIDKNISAK